MQHGDPTVTFGGERIGDVARPVSRRVVNDEHGHLRNAQKCRDDDRKVVVLVVGGNNY